MLPCWMYLKSDRGRIQTMKKLLGAILVISIALALQPTSAQDAITQEMWGNADLVKGKRLFLRCKSCHTTGQGEANKVGPNLWNIFGSQIATRDGFKYSKAVQDADFTWDTNKLSEWLANPKGFLPGTRMPFAGLKNAADRINLISFLMAETNPETEKPDESARAKESMAPVEEAN